MNELLKANPDYGTIWGKKWIYRGKITKAIVILEDGAKGAGYEALAYLYKFFGDGCYINLYHKKHVECVETMLKENKKKDSYVIVTPDIALLARRNLDFRPDNIFFFRDGKLRRADQCTDRALKEGNDLFRLYIAGEFEE